MHGYFCPSVFTVYYFGGDSNVTTWCRLRCLEAVSHSPIYTHFQVNLLSQSNLYTILMISGA